MKNWITEKYPPKKRHSVVKRIPSFFMINIMVVVSLLCSSFALASSLNKSVYSTDRLSQIDISSNVLADVKDYTQIKYLGITNKNQCLVVLNQSLLDGLGRIYWIDPSTGIVKKSLPSTSINTNGIELSSDGRKIFAFDIRALLLSKAGVQPYVNLLHLLHSSDLTPLKTVDIGRPQNIMGLSFVQNNPQQIIIKATSLLPYQGDTALLNDRFEIWDWQTTRLIRRISYSQAREVDQMLLSPNQKYLACTVSDSDGTQSGRADIINAKTGTVLWRIVSQGKAPVDAPFFYLPDGRFVSKERVYNIQTKQVAPVLPGQKDLRCVSGIPDRPGLAFLQSERGLELWDIMNRKLVKRWPQVRNAGAVFLSPDKKMMAIVASPEASTKPVGYL